MDCKGEHLLLTLKVDEKIIDLEDTKRLKNILLNAIEESGATVLESVEHHFEPQGYSVVVLIAESHASIHTWPEANCLMVDYFTCGEINTKLFKEYIIYNLKPIKIIEDRVIMRGENK